MQYTVMCHSGKGPHILHVCIRPAAAHIYTSLLSEVMWSTVRVYVP